MTLQAAKITPYPLELYETKLKRFLFIEKTEGIAMLLLLFMLNAIQTGRDHAIFLSIHSQPMKQYGQSKITGKRQLLTLIIKLVY